MLSEAAEAAVFEFALPGRFAEPLMYPADYKSLAGGRGSGKTWLAADILTLTAAQQPCKVMVARSIQDSIERSAKPAIEGAIRRLNLGHMFDVQTYQVVGRDGWPSVFHFQGTERKRDSIKGWEGYDRVWIEEAQFVSAETADILIPTIFRKEGVELWLTWNPTNQTDWVYQRFVLHGRDGDVHIEMNYDCNPHFPAKLREEMEADFKTNPEQAKHVWLGQTNDADASTLVLTWAAVNACINAHAEGHHAGTEGLVCDAGLDIADGGVDLNALCVRQGPTIVHFSDWPSEKQGHFEPTALKAHGVIDEYTLDRLCYDGTGVGSAMRGEFARIDREYSVKPINFGAGVGGPKRRFNTNKTNKDQFARRNAQLAWALRLRANKTIQLLAGDADVEPEQCLFIHSDMERARHLRLMTQLSQPKWRNNPQSGRIELDKRDGKEKSPDLFDAVCLSFARDSDTGLVAN